MGANAVIVNDVPDNATLGGVPQKFYIMNILRNLLKIQSNENIKKNNR